MFFMSYVIRQRGRKVASAFLAFVTILSSTVGNTFLMWVPTAHAASTVVVSTNGLPNGFFPNAPIGVSSGAKPILKVSVTPSQVSQTLTSMAVHFSGTGFATSDLAATSTATSSGVALYYDGNGNGFFDDTDSLVPLTNGTSGWRSATDTFDFVPATAVALPGAMVEKIFFIAIRTSASIANNDQVIAQVDVNGIVTSDGSGPSASFIASSYRADTVAPFIIQANGALGGTELSIRFNEPVARVNVSGGAPTSSLTAAASPIIYTDGGGTAQTITFVQHNLGDDLVRVTLSGGLESQDLDGSPATVAASSTVVADLAGNVAVTTSVPLASPLAITSTVVPAMVAGNSYPATSSLMTFAAQGGDGSYTWTLGNGEATSTFGLLGLFLGTNGAVTGTIPSISGSFNALIRVTDGTGASSTRMMTFSVSGSSGGGVPGITSISPPGAQRGDAGKVVRITGTNTSFTTASSVVSITMPEGTPGANGITINSSSSSGATSIAVSITVAAGAATGSRNVRVTTGAQVVSMPSGFNVSEAVGAGLNIVFPIDNATDISLPPEFSFSQSPSLSVVSYRVTLKSSADPGNTLPAIWDYAFPKTTDGSGHCGTSQCSLSYGAGIYRIITSPTSLSPNTDYYLQVRSYTTGTAAVSDSIVPMDITAQRHFRTVGSISDTTGPTINHRPLFTATSNTILNVFARMTDNIANASTTPALIPNLFYCAGSGCAPSVQTTGTHVANNVYRFQIPAGTIGNVGTIVRYHLLASDGSSNTFFRGPASTPLQLSSATSGSNTITGFVMDSANTCAASVKGAIVYAEGTGFFAYTNDSCAYTLSGLPSGTYDLVALRWDYGERRIDGRQVGATGVNFQLPSGFVGGFGGDTTRPRVRFTGPPDGMQNIPGRDSNFKIFVAFSKSMSENSITQSGNLTVNRFSPGGGTLTNVTASGSWAYYVTPPNIPGVPPEGNMAVWTMPSGTNLGDNSPFMVKVSGNVSDAAGNLLQGNQPDGSYAFGFMTSGQTFTGGFEGGTFGQGEFIPIQISGVLPGPGSLGVTTNTRIVLMFSGQIAEEGSGYLITPYVKIFPTSDVTETSIVSTVSLDTSKRVLTLGLNTSLSPSTRYRLKVLGGLKQSNGMTMAPPGMTTQVMYTSDFTTGTTGDTTAPTIVGSFPDSGATSVPVNVGSITVAFSKDMDPSTITGSSLTVSIGSTAINGSVTYRSMERQAVFTPSSALTPNTTYTITITTAVRALNGSFLATETTRTFTSDGADTGSPSISFMTVDDHAAAISFSEPMNAASVVDTLSWPRSVINPAIYQTFKFGATGFDPDSAGTSVSLNNARFTYDQPSNTVKIEGIQMTQGQDMYVAMRDSGANAGSDLSGNTFNTTTGSVLTARATVQSSSMTGGFLGPGSDRDSRLGMGGFVGGNFSTSTFGFTPPVDVRPRNTMTGVTTAYEVRLPLSRQIPASGTVVLTFPVGFDVSGAKQDIRSPQRSDINGPGSGSITFKCAASVAGGKSCSGGANADDTGDALGGLADDGVVVNTAARSVTIYVSSSTNSEGHDFLSFELDGIKNSTTPRDSGQSGYTVDVRTKNGATVIESLTSQPFFVQQGGSFTLSGTIQAVGNTSAGTMRIYLMSPMTGPLEATSVNFDDALSGAGDGAATTTYTISNLPSGDYMMFTEPFVTLGATDYAGKTIPERIMVTSTRTYNFTLRGNTVGGTNVGVRVSGPASELIDVFAHSPTGFRVIRRTLDTNASTYETFNLNLPEGQWFVGVGPQMPEGPMAGPPPAPNYLPPKPKEVLVTASNVFVEGAATTTATFTLAASSKQIKGIVKDSSNRILSGAEVFAYSPQGGFGTHAQSDTTGIFTLNVAEGTFLVGGFVPGMPPGRESTVVVSSDATNYLFISGSTTGISPANASTTFVIRIARPDFSISGTVTDGTNTVQGASVYAYRTDAPGHVNAQTNSSGIYTLYVTNGTWRVGVYLQGYGQLPEQTVTVSDASVSNQNFSPTLGGTYYSVSGSVTRDGTAVSGAFVRISGNNTFNQTNTGADGSYSFNVPAGNGYTLRANIPGVGELPALATFNVAANTTGKNFTFGAPNTVTIVFSQSVQDTLIELAAAEGAVARVNLRSGTSTSLSVPNGSYRVGITIFGADLVNSDVTATAGGTVYSTTTGILVVNGAEGLTVTVPTMQTVAGTVTDGTTGISNAWVEVVNPTTNVHFGTMSTSSGAYSINVADSAAAYTVNAMKPGYVRTPSSLTVSGSGTTTLALAMTSANRTISGRVLIGSTSATSAFVRAEKQGGGFAGAEVDSNGNFTLQVTEGSWRVLAMSMGYAETAYASNPITVNSTAVTGVNIALSSTVSLESPSSRAVTPSSGGTIEDTDQGVRLTVPSNALGTDSSAATINLTQTNSLRETSSYDPLSLGTEVTARDSSDNAITTLNSAVTIEQTYTTTTLSTNRSSSDSSINTLTEVEQMDMAYWDTTTDNWVRVPGTINYYSSTGTVVTNPAEDLSNVATVTFAAVTEHFSLYAPVASTNPNAPATPTGLAASSPGASQIRLTWNVVSGATGYNVYRSTSAGGLFPLLGTEPTVSGGSTTSYTDSGLGGGSTRYYKISALNNVGESTSTDAVSATTASDGNTVIVSSGSSGGGTGNYVAPTQTAAVTQPTTTVLPRAATTTVPVVTPPAVSTTTTVLPLTPAPVVAPVSVVTAPTTTVPVVALIPPVKKDAGLVTLVILPISNIRSGTAVMTKYRIKNETKKAIKVNVVRQVVDEKSGKVVKSWKTALTLKGRATWARDAKDVLTLPAGMYSMRILVSEAKSGEMFQKGEASFMVTAKAKVAPKTKAKVKAKAKVAPKPVKKPPVPAKKR